MQMEQLVALCKRRGFLFQSSEIYGGLNGFWDYGPLGVLLKRNVKDAWWNDMVMSHNEIIVPHGAPGTYEMTGLDCTIIMHPQIWKCSGHYDLFHDYMVDCRETKKRYRYDHIRGRWVYGIKRSEGDQPNEGMWVFATTMETENPQAAINETALMFFGMRKKDADSLVWGQSLLLDLDAAHYNPLSEFPPHCRPSFAGRQLSPTELLSLVVGPDAKHVGTLTEPREFNLMFKTTIGALGGEEDTSFLRPETAQGIFANFKNVCDSTRVRVPFGIAQVGKSFRNEITPRNCTCRSREFEQMEIEFFCPPNQSAEWYTYWRDRRFAWYVEMGLAGERLRLREHDADELSHYSCGTADIEYAFPFLPPGEFGELEGIAHRGDFDLRSHMEGKLVKEGNELVVEKLPNGQPKHRGSGKDLSYYDGLTRERFVPHVIEPSAGADRATLAFLCEAYQIDTAPDEKGQPQERVSLKFHPRLAPIKAAVFPLVKKDGMPEIASEIYGELKKHFSVFYDDKGAVGRRYRRQDEIGTPFCITVDGQTVQDGTVTIRDRDTLQQERLKRDDLVKELSQQLG
ncbi:MAG: glycine--tRNA ligase [Planctomycetaceae bacterium]|jgi:glycyl-tRNA synthetase|nr:glycine--tRNA ligase [Planctomycetaceae bacterium]